MSLHRQLLATLLCVTGCASAKIERGARGDAAEQLMNIERAIGNANVQRDRAFFERTEADEFLFTDASGGRTTKREDIASLDEPTPSTLESVTPDSMIVHVYGSSAVVWGRSVVKARRKDGTEVSRASRFTDVFVFRDGRWQLVAGHSSRIT